MNFKQAKTDLIPFLSITIVIRSAVIGDKLSLKL